MSKAARRVLLVGHCVPDSGMLQSAVRRVFPAAQVVRCNDDAQLQTGLPGADLLLINRIMDGDFADTNGLDLIRSLAAGRNGSGPALMLISNYPDAQSQAEAVGAIPGFGKDSVFTEAAADRIRHALGARP